MDVLSILCETPTASLLLFVCAITLFAFTVWPFRTRQFPTLSGPCSTWSLLGTLPQIAKRGIVECDVEWTKKYGKVFGDWMGWKYWLMTSDADIIRDVFVKESKIFANPVMMFESNDDLQSNALPFIYDYRRWKAVRSIVTPTFSSGKLKQMTPFMEHAIVDVMDSLRVAADEKKTVEMKTVFGTYTMKVISSTAFGLDIDPAKQPNHPFIESAVGSIEKFLTDPLTILASLYPAASPLVKLITPMRKRSPHVQFLDDILTSAMNDRRGGEPEKHRKDLLQLLMDAKADDKDLEGIDASDIIKGDRSKKVLTDVEVRAQSMVFLLAGYETTATTLSFMSYLLATNPDCQAKLCKEIDDILQVEAPGYDNIGKLPYLEMCLYEALRMFPPILRASRGTSEDIAIKGHFIPGGSGITVPIYVLHHDPEYWPEPEKFDPERFSPENREKNHPYAWIPFSAGPRNCVGKRMALVAAKMAMATFLQKFTFEVCDETQIPIKLKKEGFITGSEKGIHLQIHRR